eukprot:9479541-Pyramimonas_sp.AAC.1
MEKSASTGSQRVLGFEALKQPQKHRRVTRVLGRPCTVKHTPAAMYACTLVGVGTREGREHIPGAGANRGTHLQAGSHGESERSDRLPRSPLRRAKLKSARHCNQRGEKQLHTGTQSEYNG